MREYIGQPGLIPGLGVVNPGDKIDTSKLNQKLLGKLSGKWKKVKEISKDKPSKNEVTL